MDPIFFLVAAAAVLALFTAFITGLCIGVLFMSAESLTSLIQEQIENLQRHQTPPPPSWPRQLPSQHQRDLPPAPYYYTNPWGFDDDVVSELPTVLATARQHRNDVLARCQREEAALCDLMQGDAWRQARELLCSIRSRRLPLLFDEQEEMYENEHLEVHDNYGKVRRDIAAHESIYARIEAALKRDDDRSLHVSFRINNVVELLEELARTHPVYNTPPARKAQSSLLPKSFGEEPETELARVEVPPETVQRREATVGPRSLDVRPRPELPEMTVRQRKRGDGP